MYDKHIGLRIPKPQTNFEKYFKDVESATNFIAFNIDCYKCPVDNFCKFTDRLSCIQKITKWLNQPSEDTTK